MSLIDNRPTLYEYALMSEHVYHPADDPETNWRYLPHGWQVVSHEELRIHSSIDLGNYVFRAFYRENTRHCVVSHRGTKGLRDVIFDISTVRRQLNLNLNSRRIRALEQCMTAIMDYTKAQAGTLSFTGHSLGGWFSELSIAMLYKNSSQFVEDGTHINAVTFDNPGAKQICTHWIKKKYKEDQEALGNLYHEELASIQAKEFLDNQDIANLIFPANLINTFHQRTQKNYYLPVLYKHDKKNATIPGYGSYRKHDMHAAIRYFSYQVRTACLSLLTPIAKWQNTPTPTNYVSRTGLPSQIRAITQFSSATQPAHTITYNNEEYRQLKLQISPFFAPIEYATFSTKTYQMAHRTGKFAMELNHFSNAVIRILQAMHNYRHHYGTERLKEQLATVAEDSNTQHSVRLIQAELDTFQLYQQNSDGAYQQIQSNHLLKYNTIITTVYTLPCNFRTQISKLTRYQIRTEEELLVTDN